MQCGILDNPGTEKDIREKIVKLEWGQKLIVSYHYSFLGYMLMSGEAEWKVYENLVLFCNISVILKLFQDKTSKKNRLSISNPIICNASTSETFWALTWCHKWKIPHLTCWCVTVKTQVHWKYYILSKIILRPCIYGVYETQINFMFKLGDHH